MSGCASTGGRIPTYPLEDLFRVTDVTVVCNGQMSAPPARQPPSKIGAGEEMRGVADDPKVASKINFAGIRPRARSCRPAGLRNLEWPRVGVTVANGPVTVADASGERIPTYPSSRFAAGGRRIPTYPQTRSTIEPPTLTKSSSPPAPTEI